jgi:hypothetical protein
MAEDDLLAWDDEEPDPTARKVEKALAAITPKDDARQRWRIGPLKTLDHVADELRRVYRAARISCGDELNARDAKRLADILRGLSEQIIAGGTAAALADFSRRLEAMESKRRPMNGAVRP